jgi:hypothetical protein
MSQLLDLRQLLEILDTVAKVCERMTKDHQTTIIKVEDKLHINQERQVGCFLKTCGRRPGRRFFFDSLKVEQNELLRVKIFEDFMQMCHVNQQFFTCIAIGDDFGCVGTILKKVARACIENKIITETQEVSLAKVEDENNFFSFLAYP